jgi:prepilin-type N-terminal cleavage/methylation domain-containing protein
MARRQKPFKLHREKGFSLVEALVTLFLVGVLAAMFLTFVRQGMRSSTAALHISEATSVASSLMSEILTRLNDEDSGKVQQGGRDYQWEVKILPILGEEAERVDLTIAWTEPAGPQRMTVSTLRAVERLGPTGLGSPESETGPGGSPSESGDSTPSPSGTGEDGPSS